MALPVLVLAIAVVLGAGAVGRAQVQCQDAARAAARLVARGEPAASISATVSATAPAGSTVAVSDAGQGQVRVTVSSEIPLLAEARLSGDAVLLSCAATAWREVESATSPGESVTGPGPVTALITAGRAP